MSAFDICTWRDQETNGAACTFLHQFTRFALSTDLNPFVNQGPAGFYEQNNKLNAYRIGLMAFVEKEAYP